MEISRLDRISGNLLYTLSRMVSKTCRYQDTGLEHLQAVFSGDKPVIIACWHGMTMMVIPYASIFEDFSSFVTIMPDDWRGASLKVFADRLGAFPFPMNLHGDSTMSQGRELVKLVREVVGGKHLYFTPDGPDGPSYVIKPGMTFIAKKANAVLLPIGAYTRNAYIVPRWDRYTIPFPFSRVSVCIGKPIHIPPDAGDLKEYDLLLTNILHHLTMQAGANYYERKP